LHGLGLQYARAVISAISAWLHNVSYATCVPIGPRAVEAQIRPSTGSPSESPWTGRPLSRKQVLKPSAPRFLRPLLAVAAIPVLATFAAAQSMPASPPVKMPPGMGRPVTEAGKPAEAGAPVGGSAVPLVPGGPTQDAPLWGYLDNGMAYILLESHAAPLIGSSVIVHSGSAREEFATSGASHFLEHLLFNGTETRTQEQLYEEVDALGGYNNATTRQTHVLYMMVTPAEKIRQGIEIQRDMLFHSTLPAEKIEKERGIILEELAKDSDQGTFERDRALDLCAFGPQGPGLPVVGSEQSIRQMTREAIAGFYHRFYTPQNMTLVVIGDFKSKDMESMIRSTFGEEPPGIAPPPLSIAEPPFDDSRRVVYHDGNSNLLEWVFRGPDPQEADYTPFACLTDLLTGDDASPLAKILRDRFPEKILGVGAHIQLLPGRSYLRLQVETDPSLDWKEVAREMPATLARVASPSPEEIASWRVGRETAEYFLREKPHYYGIIRGDEIAAQGVDAVLGLPQWIASLSPADIARVRPGWASGSFRMAVALPNGSAVPDSVSAPPAVTLHTTLPNGLELLVISSSESPVLALHLFLRGRSEAEPAGMDGAVELLHRLMTTRTVRFDPPALQRRIREIGAEIKTADDPNIPYDDFYSTPAASFVRLQTLDRNAEEAFQLLAEFLATPGWTDTEFQDARAAMVATAERAGMSSSAVGRQLVRHALYGDSWRSRAVFGTPATLQAITPEALRALAGRYWVGRRMILVVATSLPPARIEELAARHLGPLPPGDAPPPPNQPPGVVDRIRSALPSSDPLPQEITGLQLPDSTLLRSQKIGGRQASLTLMKPLGRIERDALPAIEVWNAVLSSAIQFQLREREGLAYSIGSSIDRLPDGTLLWVASAGAGTKNLGRILGGFEEELRAALRAAPDTSAVRKQGAQLYGRSLMRRATRMNRAYAAGLAILNDDDPLKIDEEIRKPTLVTRDGISGILPRLRPAGPSVVAIAY
jgi:zinc protease